MKLIEGQENWKIHPPNEIFYIESIRIAAESAINSWEEINAIVSNKEKIERLGLATIDLSEIIINQAGIISRYFYPSLNIRKSDKNKIHILRGEKLKEYYGITDSNILKNRTFRNYIEHFDENLDEFLNNSIAGNIIPKTIFIESSEIDEITFVFKAYVLTEFKLISLNKQIELIPLMEEIYRIQNTCVDFSQNGGRLEKLKLKI